MNTLLLFCCLLGVCINGQTMPYVVVPVEVGDKDKSVFNKLNRQFLTTIRSCLSSGCYNVKPDKSINHRIGLLGLPNSGASIVDNLIRDIQSKGGNKDTGPDVVYSTHVPAYGYGKNHGWSRIIRITRMPVDNTYSILNGHNQDLGYGNNAAFDAQVCV